MLPLAMMLVRRRDSLSEVVRNYESHGFPSRFVTRPGGNVFCVSCQRDNPARWVKLLALHHVEGGSKPQEEAAVAALECPACEERGTLALALGAEAPVTERLVLSLFDDRRGESAADVVSPLLA